MNELKITISKVPDNRHLFGLTHKAAQSIHCVEVIKNDFKIDAKSLLGLLALGLRIGDVVTFRSEDVEVLNVIREHLEG